MTVLTDDNITGPTIQKADSTNLYAILLSKDKKLLVSKAINKEGAYIFDGEDGVKPNTEFTIALATSSNQKDMGLPKRWNSTGERINSLDMPKERINNSIITVKVDEKDISDIDFGINKQPVAEAKIVEIQLNPGLAMRVSVPKLSGDDKESGKKLLYKIASLPTLGTLYHNNIKVEQSGLMVEEDDNLSMDPHQGDTVVLFSYVTIDEAGVVSDPARVSMPFKGLSISGYIVDDGNGDNAVKGKRIKIPKKLHPYATLLDDNNTILASKPLPRNASFLFDGKDGIRPNANFTVVMSLEKNALEPVLPAGWVHSGEEVDTQSSKDSKSDGKLSVFVREKNIENIEFGINKKPSADLKTAHTQVNPGADIKVTVPTLTGNDRESGTTLKYMVTKIPQNAILYSKGIVVNNHDYVDPASLTLDPNDGKQIVTFSYVSVDSEGILSDPATVTSTFTGLNISGKIYEDFMMDGNVDAAQTIAADKLRLYINLLNEKGEILDSIPTSGDGSYLITEESGVNANTKYTLVLSKERNSTISTLPEGWNYADGENVNSLAKGNDGKADGMIDIFVKEKDLKEVDFGINYFIN